MSIISDLGDGILSHLTALGRSTAASMLPGLDETEIRQACAAVALTLPRSAIELYQWSGGLRPGSGICTEFFPGYGMDSFWEMVEIYSELSNAPDYPRFRKETMTWFPIFRSGGTDFYGICCNDRDAEEANIIDDDNEAEPEVAYLSLASMLRTHLECFETGVYYVNEQGILTVGVPTYNDHGQLVEVDLSKFNEVALEFNPGLKRYA